MVEGQDCWTKTNDNFCLADQPDVVNDPVDHVLLFRATKDVSRLGLEVQTTLHLKRLVEK